ncbi:sphingosine kinase [Tersicoccus solisilvae]|uniref:Sphingosine kinase n=1 Tax=Tersicoccus solisilvae TaxID=1882339 RepID=A0ABQ1NHX7_9MICC|nr:diacylglycerol kinase family protein [Tersicoccus solisilvae]GGC77564.1 sphingosine kinase [Tersicoccus solisilvae]
MTETRVPLIARAVASLTGSSRVTHLPSVQAVRARHVRSAVNGETTPRHEGPQRVTVVLNPIKSNADQARQRIAAVCRDAGWEEPRFFETTVEDAGVAMTRDALGVDPDVVIAGGGDGTIRMVAHALAGSDVPMGIVPLGTGNLLARNLDIDPDDLDGNIEAALFGVHRAIDTSTVRLERKDGSVDEHTGLVMAGIGFDAEVIAGTRDDLKSKISWLAYGEAGVRKLVGRRHPVEMDLDDRGRKRFRMRSVLVANCGLLPGGIDFIPDAVIDDGTLNVVIMAPRNMFEWFAVLGKVVFKHRRSLPAIRYYDAREAQISTEDALMTQVDGDETGDALAMRVTVNPGALTVRVLSPTMDRQLSDPA